MKTLLVLTSLLLLTSFKDSDEVFERNKYEQIFDELLVQIAMIEGELLPPFNMGHNEPILIEHVYTTNDMYLEGKNPQDKERFAMLGY